MSTWTPDPTFYPSPRAAMDAPREELAYVAMIEPEGKQPDALAVMDVNPQSPDYGRIINRLTLPNVGDELHHFGWNACSAALCPTMPHPHIERRYLLVPGLRSSRMYIVDTKPDPRRPRIVKTIEPDELQGKSGYSRPHTTHCGPDAIYVSALGAPGGDGPGGVFLLDHQTFEVQGAWEKERGSQRLAYDFWWHLGFDTMITSEWGTPNMVENGLNGEILMKSGYGHQLHIWDLPKRRHRQVIDLGSEYQMVLELRPAHDPTRPFGFVGVVTSLKDLSSSIWAWRLEGSNGSAWRVHKVIDIPAEPADPDQLPPVLKPFKAVPPLLTDINLSLDDRYLYASCWGTGELKQYDVSDPLHPAETGSVKLGGIVRREKHPRSGPLLGGPQMVEVSRDGRRVYVTNSLYRSWDDQFYPEGMRGWLARIEARPEGGIALDPKFFVESDQRLHQVHLEGGDASSDSYCFA